MSDGVAECASMSLPMFLKIVTAICVSIVCRKHCVTTFSSRLDGSF
jgi:hypothetical protein